MSAPSSCCLCAVLGPINPEFSSAAAEIFPQILTPVMNRLEQPDKNNSSLPTGIMWPDNTMQGPCNSTQGGISAEEN